MEMEVSKLVQVSQSLPFRALVEGVIPLACGVEARPMRPRRQCEAVGGRL